MAGYNGYSMSNNAVDAYENGEKPLSRWTKKDIISAIEEEAFLKCSLEKLKKTPLRALKGLCLHCTSWHHTSSHYNRTDFYSLNISYIESLTDDDLDRIVEYYKPGEDEEPTEEIWECAFLEWSGTRKHPKATEIIEIGTVKEGWFIRANGKKKKTTANGFRFIKKIQ